MPSALSGSLHTRPKFCSVQCSQAAWQIGRRTPLTKWLRAYLAEHGPSLSHDVRAAAVAAGYRAATVSQARKQAGAESVVLYEANGNTLGAVWSLPGGVAPQSAAA